MATPYMPRSAQLAFAGSTAVLAIQQGGSITQPISYASEQSGKWTAFKQLANTWTRTRQPRAGADHVRGPRAGQRGQQRLLRPWCPAGPAARSRRLQLTGDKSSCAPSSHDPVADASGRMADISMECGDVAIANLTDTLHAAVVRFANGGTFGGGEPAARHGAARPRLGGLVHRGQHRQ